ncbi:MAG: peptidoglycan bridge formation glycyltransferase FemA/FemB family protein [Oscillospiraceae bacterium]|nr:peptidoglycan bridge formation glycyltransferase FemA/FemB family protein [Oscillospiraceae bacterium]
MEILKKELYSEFDAFCSTHPKGAFQQAPAWAKVKKDWEHEIVVTRDENGNIVGGVSVLIRKIGPFGMMYAPRGPVCDYTDKAVMKDLIEGIRVVAKKHHGYKFICDPLVLVSDAETIQFFKDCGFSIKEHAAFRDTIQPRYNYMLTYIKDMSEEALLKKFSSKTRYYINYGPKHGVVVKEGIEYLDDFYRIYSETGRRKNFTIRSKAYLESMLTSFPDNARLYMCYHQNDETGELTALCGGLSVQYAGTTSHVYGCSTSTMSNLKATNVLQWAMMKWALAGNCHTYDMQGIATNKEDDEELYSVYLFKAKFEGGIVETAGEFTITFNPLADKLISLALNIRSKLKHH